MDDGFHTKLGYIVYASASDLKPTVFLSSSDLGEWLKRNDPKLPFEVDMCGICVPKGTATMVLGYEPHMWGDTVGDVMMDDGK